MPKNRKAATPRGRPREYDPNQALARALFPNQSPLGRIVKIPRGKKDAYFEIVGVAADARYYDVHKVAQPFVWFSIEQLAPYLPTLHVRTNRSDTASMTAAIRQEFDLLDRGFPVFNIRTLGGGGLKKSLA